MKRTFIILGCISLVCVLLIVRLFLTQSSGLHDEREWFVESLRYEFAAEVDSIRMLNKNAGRVWCHLSSGDPRVNREDSLKLLFKEHDMLYLIIKRAGDTITFVAPNAFQVSKGDSLSVSSSRNSIQFFRGDSLVATDHLSNTLTGFSRPFFMKNKR